MAKKKAVVTDTTNPIQDTTPQETSPVVTQTSETETVAAPATTPEAKEAAPKKAAKSGEAKSESAKSTAKAPKTMEELLSNPEYAVNTPKKGETVTGIITDKTRKMLMIDIGGKTEGIVTDKEFEAARDYIDQLNIGDPIEAYVLSSENDRGQILLSLKKAALDTKWDEFTDALKTGATVEVKGIEINKGGLIVAVDGVRGFIPSSQFGKEYIGNLMKLKNRKIEVKVIEVDKEKNRLIFSEKHVSEASELAQRAQALGSVKVGETYAGVISGIMPFGLFVTVNVPLGEADSDQAGHVEGLVHISEISWEKVNDPRELFTAGQQLKVKVLGVDETAGKLNLSLKQLLPDPWVEVEGRYPVGTTLTGKVSRVVPFGVFVKIEPGIDGLIHTSKLTPDQSYESGDSVTVSVESVDPGQRRMSLSAVLTEVPMGYK